MLGKISGTILLTNLYSDNRNRYNQKVHRIEKTLLDIKMYSCNIILSLESTMIHK